LKAVNLKRWTAAKLRKPSVSGISDEAIPIHLMEEEEYEETTGERIIIGQEKEIPTTSATEFWNEENMAETEQYYEENEGSDILYELQTPLQSNVNTIAHSSNPPPVPSRNLKKIASAHFILDENGRID